MRFHISLYRLKRTYEDMFSEGVHQKRELFFPILLVYWLLRRIAILASDWSKMVMMVKGFHRRLTLWCYETIHTDAVWGPADKGSLHAVTTRQITRCWVKTLSSRCWSRIRRRTQHNRKFTHPRYMRQQPPETHHSVPFRVNVKRSKHLTRCGKH